MCSTMMYQGKLVTYARSGGRLGGPSLSPDFQLGVPVEGFWGPRPVELRGLTTDLQWTTTGWVKAERIAGLLSPTGGLSTLPEKPTWGTLGQSLNRIGRQMSFILLPTEFMEGGSYFDFRPIYLGTLGLLVMNRVYVVTVPSTQTYAWKTRNDRMPLGVPARYKA